MPSSPLPALPTFQRAMRRAARAAAALLLGAGCAGPDLGPSRGTQGPAWIPDPVLRSAVGAVSETRSYRAQRQAQQPVRFVATGEREALLRAAEGALRTRGLTVRPRLAGEPLHTTRQDRGLRHGTVGSRPAVLTHSYALVLEPLALQDALDPRWQLTLRLDLERCSLAEEDEPELTRSCAPLSEVTPDLQRELESVGEALRTALAPEAAAARR